LEAEIPETYTHQHVGESASYVNVSCRKSRSKFESVLLATVRVLMQSDLTQHAVPVLHITGYLYSAQCKWRSGENNRLGLDLG